MKSELPVEDRLGSKASGLPGSPASRNPLPVSEEGRHQPRSGNGWLLIPREHGAWGMVGFPFFATIAAVPGEWFHLRTLAVLVAVLAVFLLRDPLVACWRARRDPARDPAEDASLPNAAIAKRSLLIYSTALGISGSVLLMTLPVFWILLLGSCGLALVFATVVIALERIQREISLQLVSVAGLTASCLPAYLTMHGRLDWVALVIWILSATHSIASVLVVRARLESIVARRRQASATTGNFWRAAVLWQLGLWSALASLSWLGQPYLVLPYLFPCLLHARELVQFRLGTGLRRPLRKVGWWQLSASGVFYAVMILLFRFQLLQ